MRLGEVRLSAVVVKYVKSNIPYKCCRNVQHYLCTCVLSERDGVTAGWTALHEVELRGWNYVAVIFW